MELLEKMDVQAGLTVQKIYQEDEDREVVHVNIEGSDLSFLIGRRAETLNALQYITSLMVNKKLNQWVPLQLDIQNFRQRRELELQKLARRMAEQVISTAAGNALSQCRQMNAGLYTLSCVKTIWFTLNLSARNQIKDLHLPCRIRNRDHARFRPDNQKRDGDH